MSSFLSDNIDEALACWKAGGLVAIPTETVYGLGAPVDREDLILKIFSYKERPFYDPLIVHISDKLMAKNYVETWDPLTELLTEKFWPGPLTIVLKKTNLVSDMITSGLPTVGIRCPKNKQTLDLINALGVGVAAPSANKFTKTSPTNKDHVLHSFKDDHLCILTSDEKTEVGIESTIISIENELITLLRPGIITQIDIEEALKGEKFQFSLGKTAFEEKAPTAPGQDPVHYRPTYKLELMEGKGQIIEKEGAEYVLLDKDPYITARELYLLMRDPLKKSFNRRVFVLPESRHHLNDKEKQVWQSILNRLVKAGEWV